MPDTLTPEERLQNLVIEASVTGSSQGVLSADLRRRIDAAVEDIKRAHIDALTAAGLGVVDAGSETVFAFSHHRGRVTQKMEDAITNLGERVDTLAAAILRGEQ